MKGDDYPLAAVRAARLAERDRAEHELAARLAALADARRSLTRQQEALLAHRDETRRIEARESRTQDRRNADALQRGQSFVARRRLEAAAFEGRVSQAEQAAMQAEQAAMQARKALADAHARARAVERHEERWREERRRERDRREENELEDHPGRGRGRQP